MPVLKWDATAFRDYAQSGEANLVALCAAHHLHGVHIGWVRVHGRAPGGLTWQLGVRDGVPLVTFPAGLPAPAWAGPI